MMTPLQASADQVAAALSATGRQLVLAESCTAGLVAATLGSVPGISRHLCGSAVVYQERTKAAWLGVPDALFADPGVVSAEVAIAMAAGALARTPHADLAASVTGHLGPDAPNDLNGLIYVAVGRRGLAPQASAHRLAMPEKANRRETRRSRQSEAATIVLREILTALDTYT